MFLLQSNEGELFTLAEFIREEQKFASDPENIEMLEDNIEAVKNLKIGESYTVDMTMDFVTRIM